MAHLIFDSNAICHSVRYTMGDLSYEDLQTGIIFGFLRNILSVSKKTKSTSFIFTWDSVKSKRKNIFPEYKAHRKTHRTEEEEEDIKLVYEQFNALRQDILPYLGFNNIFYQIGYEADDLIASIVKHNTGDFIIVSADSDLYQLLSANVSMYNIKTKKIYSSKDFQEEYGIYPYQWAQVKEIAGCNSDGVPGVKGVGEKGACQFINNKLKITSKKYLDITSHEGKKVRERNYKLVSLPFKGVKPCLIKEDNLNIDSFIKVCESFDFQSMLKSENIASWQTIFGGKN